MFGALDQTERKELISTILDFFRLEFAIHSENYLTQSKLKENEKLFGELLRRPWSLDRNEKFKEPYYIRLETLNKNARLFTKSMGPASSLGKFIKQYIKMKGIDIDLKRDGYREFILQTMDMLEQADYLKSFPARSEQNEDVKIYRLRLESIIWKLGDKTTVKADVIKRRSYKELAPKPNDFFQNLYQRDFSVMKRFRGEDHTGQLNTDTRLDSPPCQDSCRLSWRDFVLISWGKRKGDDDIQVLRRIQGEYYRQTVATEQRQCARGIERNRHSQGHPVLLAA